MLCSFLVKLERCMNLERKSLMIVKFWVYHIIKWHFPHSSNSLASPSLSKSFGYLSNLPYLQLENNMQFPLKSWHWGLGLCCYPLKYLRFHKLTPSPNDHPTYPMSFNHLVVFMVQKLLSIEGLFPSPPTPPLQDPKYYRNILLYFRLKEAEFNGTKQFQKHHFYGKHTQVRG